MAVFSARCASQATSSVKAWLSRCARSRRAQLGDHPMGRAARAIGRTQRASERRSAGSGAPRPAPQTDVDDELVVPELDGEHADSWDGEQAAEHGDAQHPDVLDRFVRFEAHA